MSLTVWIEKKIEGFTLDVSFSCENERTAILGASGCGKSLTLRCIAGIETPDRGRIVLNGKVLFDSEQKINLPPQDRKVGYLFQHYALFPNMTVEKNIACGVHDVKEIRKKRQLVDEIIKKMKLSGLENRKPDQLSGGQQQRVALARILVGNPEILLLDEPFSALDSHLKGHVIEEVKQMLETYAKEVLLVTHNKEEAYEICPKLLVMENGKIDCSGNTKELFEHPNTDAASLLIGKTKTGGSMEQTFTHFDTEGNAVMVDVSEKQETRRIAVASGIIKVNQAVMDAIVHKSAAKGDVLGVARVAGIMAVKQTANLIPMCHTLLITKCSVDFEVQEELGQIKAICTAKVEGKTGVEMEAMTGASVALLTIYDMCKAMDRGMEISEIHLDRKEGGKSGVYER